MVKERRSINNYRYYGLGYSKGQIWQHNFLIIFLMKGGIGVMTLRQKKVFSESLKAKDYKINDVPFSSAKIIVVRDIETKFQDSVKTLLEIETEEGDNVSVFLNQKSINNLVDDFGENDESWVGKKIKSQIEKDETFGQLMIVCSKAK